MAPHGAELRCQALASTQGQCGDVTPTGWFSDVGAGVEITMSNKQIIFCNLCNQDSVRFPDRRIAHSQDRRNGRRIYDGRMSVVHETDDSPPTDWLCDEEADVHVCPLCVERVRRLSSSGVTTGLGVPQEVLDLILR